MALASAPGIEMFGGPESDIAAQQSRAHAPAEHARAQTDDS